MTNDYSGKETQNFDDFGLEKGKFSSFSPGNANSGIFDVQFLANGIVFTKIGLANSTILKLWAAHPYRKFGHDPPPACLQHFAGILESRLFGILNFENGEAISFFKDFMIWFRI